MASSNVALWHCSSRSEKGRKVAERFGSKKVTADYREVLSEPEVDMVILAVPHEMHLFFIREVLNAGKNLLCEKPMTMTVAEVAGMRATYLGNRAMDSIRLGAPLPVNVEEWDMYVHT